MPHDAFNVPNIGSKTHWTHREAVVQMANDERPAPNIGIGRWSVVIALFVLRRRMLLTLESIFGMRLHNAMNI